MRERLLKQAKGDRFDLEMQYQFQTSIDSIVKNYFMSQNHDVNQLLKYVHAFTKHYNDPKRIVSLAILMNHMLKLLPPETEKPIFSIHSSSPVYIKELQASILVNLEIGETLSDTYILKKFLWGDDEESLLIPLLSLYCHYAYIKQPEKLQFINLYSGKITTHHVTSLFEATVKVKEWIQMSQSKTIKGSCYTIIKR